MFIHQEDLTPDEVGPIIDELKAGKIPKPGPRFVSSFLCFGSRIVNYIARILT